MDDHQATPIKIVVVGNRTAGKTSLLTRYITGEFPSNHCLKFPQNMVTVAEGQWVSIDFLDTETTVGSSKIKPSLDEIPSADVFLLLVAINTEHQLQQAKDCWWPDLHYHCPGIPLILVGSKLDMKDQRVHSIEEGLRVAEDIGAVKYMECSALNNGGVKQLFDEAFEIALEYQNRPKLKLVVVGHGAMGKTSLLARYSTGEFPTEYCPQLLKNSVKVTIVEGVKVNVNFWDTGGAEDYNRIRPLCYPNTDVFLLLVAICAKGQLKEAKSYWQPELKHFSPGVPIILVGSKSDLQSQRAFSFEEGQRMAEKIEAVKYMECSALENVGVDEVFEEAVRTGMEYQNKPNVDSRSCNICQMC